MRAISVTGSEGLIGRAVLRALCASGHGVRRLDLALSAGVDGAGDLLDPQALARAFADPGSML